MTNLLLIIIAVLMLARIVLQVRQGKRAYEKGYCAPSEVENIRTTTRKENVWTTLNTYGKQGYELVQVIPHNDSCGSSEYQLYFTRKKTKNYYEK